MRIFRHYIHTSFVLLGFIESLIFFVSMYAGILLSVSGDVTPVKAIETCSPCAVLFAVSLSLPMVALGLYDKEIFRDFGTIVVRMTVGFVIGLILLALTIFVLPSLRIWSGAFAMAMVFAVGGMLGAHLLFLRLVNSEVLKRRILVLGTGDQAARIEALERDGQASCFVCVGYLWVNGLAPRIKASRIISPVNSLDDFVKGNKIEEIVIAVEDRRGRLPVSTLMECKLNGTAITDYQDFYERETGRVDLENLTPRSIIFFDVPVSGQLQQVAKWVCDVALSLAFCIFMLPLITVTAVAIRLESRGPIFYRQERTGLCERPFMLLKFRSMRVDAEKDGVPKWASSNDPRITRVGAFIRRTRIDEIPQVINVLKGEMSLVGPRPERPFFVEKLSREVPLFDARFRVKPGITGWAQVKYSYTGSIEGAKQKLAYDLYYVKNHSFFLDLIIILQTVRVIFWPPGVH
jgi:sugar transferase (PEP-CTERM system associated)